MALRLRELRLEGVDETDHTLAVARLRQITGTGTAEAVEIDRVLPVSGNLAICGQQFWLGPGRTHAHLVDRHHHRTTQPRRPASQACPLG